MGLPLGLGGDPGGGTKAGANHGGSVPSGGMGTSQAGLMAGMPPQMEEDIEHLLSTLAARLRLGTPRITTYQWQ